MKLLHDLNLAYCTNVHRGSSWEETFESLKNYVLKVRDLICPKKRFAIGLRLGADAAKSLSDPVNLLSFQKWLDKKNCYIFTINGFPYGNFHGTRVRNKSIDLTGQIRIVYLIQFFFSKSLKNFYTTEKKVALAHFRVRLKNFINLKKFPVRCMKIF